MGNSISRGVAVYTRLVLPLLRTYQALQALQEGLGDVDGGGDPAGLDKRGDDRADHAVLLLARASQLWAVAAMCHLADGFLDFFLGTVPGWSMLKLIGQYWLYSARTSGYLWVYQRVVHAFLHQHMDSVQNGYRTAIGLLHPILQGMLVFFYASASRLIRAGHQALVLEPNSPLSKALTVSGFGDPASAEVAAARVKDAVNRAASRCGLDFQLKGDEEVSDAIKTWRSVLPVWSGGAHRQQPAVEVPPLDDQKTPEEADGHQEDLPEGPEAKQDHPADITEVVGEVVTLPEESEGLTSRRLRWLAQHFWGSPKPSLGEQ